MTIFLAGIPSASWRLLAAGLTSPAWVRAPSPAAEEEIQICGRMAFRSCASQEATLLHLKPNPTQHLSGPSSLDLTPPPLSPFFSSLPQTHSPHPLNLILVDTVRNKKKNLPHMIG